MIKRIVILPLLFAIVASCGGGNKADTKVLAGTIKIDGSSTVHPITSVIAEKFKKKYDSVEVLLGISGTSGGFQKFINQEIDIADASRMIKPKEEKDCKEKGIQYIDLMVGYDGLVIIVNPENDWADKLTVEELKLIWGPESENTIKTWDQIRPEWPKEEFVLFGPGLASGTYDFFTKVIIGESGSSRGDFATSEDDNYLVQGVSSMKNSLGFVGYSYYSENKDKLKAVAIDNGNGAVLPSIESILSGKYAPLVRPLYVYSNNISLKKPQVNAFLTYYLDNASSIAEEVSYIPLPDSLYTEQNKKLSKFVELL